MINTTCKQDVNIKNVITENIIRMIFLGTLNRGDFLPSIRNMCARYHVSRNTVVAAYKDLESLGFIQGKERSCYQVLGRSRAATKVLPTEPQPVAYRKISPYKDACTNLTDIANRLLLNEQASFTRHFIKRWCDDFYRTKDPLPEKTLADRENIQLKLNMMRYLKITRGIETAEENMLLMQGQQEALATIAHFGKQLKNKPSIILGDPVSPKIFQLFSCMGYEIIFVPVDKEGLNVAAFPEKNVDFVYVSPSSHFPSGARMSDRNRQLLLTWCQQNDAIIIEDDACFMLGFGQEIIPPLHASYPAPDIIYLYNLNELVVNSVNLSLLMIPDALFPHIRKINSLINSNSSTLNGRMLGSFLGSNYLMKYLATTLQQRQQKYELAVQGLKQLTANPDDWGLIHSGFFSFAMEEDRLPAEMKGSLFYPLALFNQQPRPSDEPPRYIYPLGSLTVNEIEKINQRLLAHSLKRHQDNSVRI